MKVIPKAHLPFLAPTKIEKSSLHLRSCEVAGTGASGANSSERPSANDGVVFYRALQGQAVAAGVNGFDSQLKCSGDAAVEIATQNERGGLGFASDEARTGRSESEIRHGDRV